jgi:hypothetical protein
MPLVGLEPIISVFGQAKTVPASDRVSSLTILKFQTFPQFHYAAGILTCNTLSTRPGVSNSIRIYSCYIIKQLSEYSR